MALASVVLADSLSVFDPASPQARSIQNLFYLILAITGAIFVLVEGMLVYCIVRFRRSPPSPTGTVGSEAPPADNTEPPQIYGSQPIEVAWTVAPLLIVFVIFLIVVRTVGEIRRDQPPPGTEALQITVVGHQWWWEYQYRRWNEQALSARTANEMHVPIGTPVYLDLKSADVVHSFWVPRLAGKTDVFPGRTNHLWFQAEAAGIFRGQCAEYCGTQHANMLLSVVAEPAADFEKWLENQTQGAKPVSGEGRDLFFSLNCVNCHSVRGTTAAGTFGPDLTHLMARETLAATMIPRNRKHLEQWVTDPQKLKPGCRMPSLHLSPRQVDLVVDYLETLD